MSAKSQSLNELWPQRRALYYEYCWYAVVVVCSRKKLEERNHHRTVLEFHIFFSSIIPIWACAYMSLLLVWSGERELDWSVCISHEWTVEIIIKYKKRQALERASDEMKFPMMSLFFRYTRWYMRWQRTMVNDIINQIVCVMMLWFSLKALKKSDWFSPIRY